MPLCYHHIQHTHTHMHTHHTHHTHHTRSHRSGYVAKERNAIICCSTFSKISSSTRTNLCTFTHNTQEVDASTYTRTHTHTHTRTHTRTHTSAHTRAHMHACVREKGEGGDNICETFKAVRYSRQQNYFSRTAPKRSQQATPSPESPLISSQPPLR